MGHSVNIEPLLLEVQRPARYIGGEVGAITKPPDAVRLRLALCFPDIYEVAESHLGLKILYHLFNTEPDIAAERVYAPWPDMARALEANDLPLFSLETRSPMASFDAVCFSLNHELSYPTVLHMLSLGRVPLLASDRIDRDPLVIAGGPAVMNPEPVADFFDAFYVGDGEPGAVELARALIETADQPRRERLQQLAQLKGIYVPTQFKVSPSATGVPIAVSGQAGAPARISSRRLLDLDAAPAPERFIVPHVRPVHDRAVVEIQRGCTRGCRFCQAGMIYRPTRQRSPAKIAEIMRRAIDATGYAEAGLLSLSAGDYGPIETLLTGLGHQLEKERVALSVPSLRVESLSPVVAREVSRMRKSSFTLAPEAATDRLRRVIAKGNSEEDLRRSIRAAIQVGATRIKLYFMIGLPTETDEDVAAIPRLTMRLLAEARQLQRRARITVSISTFVPKAHTPFQWEAQLGLDEIRRKQQLVRAGLKGGNVSLRWHDAGMSLVEGVYARGDRRLSGALLEAHRRGAQLDSWTEHFDLQRHLEALETVGLDPGQFLRTRELDESLPWEVIDPGVLAKFLLRERADAMQEQERCDCVLERCRACGVCDFDQVRLVTYRNGSDGVAQRLEKPPLHRDNRHLAAVPVGDPLQDSDAVDEASDPALNQREADPRQARLRLRFAKTAPAVHLSHLETMGAINRALRRAKLPVSFSGGFHATPRVSAPYALPTGMVSRDELVDVDMREITDAQSALRVLQVQLPRGLQLLDAVSLAPGAPGLGEIIGGARYHAQLSIEAERVQADVERFLATTQWPIQRERKGRRNEVDLKQLLTDLELSDGGVEFVLRSPPSGTVRPQEALVAVFGDGCVTRAGLEKRATLFAHDLADMVTAEAESPKP